MTDMHLRRVKDDGFKAEDPDNLMASVARTDLKRPLKISLLLHVGIIFVLSLGTLGLCIKYKTVNPRTAIERRNEAALEKAASLKAAEKETRKQELAAKAEGAATESTNGAPRNGKAKILEEISEVSDERPNASSMDSIDDLLED